MIEVCQSVSYLQIVDCHNFTHFFAVSLKMLKSSRWPSGRRRQTQEQLFFAAMQCLGVLVSNWREEWVRIPLLTCAIFGIIAEAFTLRSLSALLRILLPLQATNFRCTQINNKSDYSPKECTHFILEYSWMPVVALQW